MQGVSLAELFEKKWKKRPILSEKERKSTFALINSAYFDDKGGGISPNLGKLHFSLLGTSLSAVFGQSGSLCRALSLFHF